MEPKQLIANNLVIYKLESKDKRQELIEKLQQTLEEIINSLENYISFGGNFENIKDIELRHDYVRRIIEVLKN